MIARIVATQSVSNLCCLTFLVILKTPVGRRATSGLMWLFERLGLAPRGAHHVATILNRGVDALTRGGQLSIFTPMYFTLARKPLI